GNPVVFFKRPIRGCRPSSSVPKNEYGGCYPSTWRDVHIRGWVLYWKWRTCSAIRLCRSGSARSILQGSIMPQTIIGRSSCCQPTRATSYFLSSNCYLLDSSKD